MVESDCTAESYDIFTQIKKYEHQCEGNQEAPANLIMLDGGGMAATPAAVAAMTFMGVGFVVASFTDPDYFPFMRFLRSTKPMDEPFWWTKLLALGFISLLLVKIAGPYKVPTFNPEEGTEIANEVSALYPQESRSNRPTMNEKKSAASFISGSLFALGLSISQMVNNSKVLDFLDLSLIPQGRWDPSLAFVMGGGVIVSACSYQFIKGFNKIVPDEKTLTSPLICEADELLYWKPAKSVIDKKVLIGGMAFGMGWGIGGICPGPSLYLALVGQPEVLLFYMPSLALGVNMASISERRMFEDNVNNDTEGNEIIADQTRQGRRSSYRRASFMIVEKFNDAA